ncbi:MAG: NAD-dependent epimerase/dehydratase family protein [Candidatus Binatia bacterium]
MTRGSSHPLADDLDHVLDHTRGLWEELRGQRIFITGGTGFVGCWLLETFAWANRHLALQAQAVVLSRNPAAFARKAPHLAKDPAITFHTGDVRNFDVPAGEFSHIIHAATEVTGTLQERDPLAMFDTIVEGTHRVLELARRRGTKRILLTSSGAVYGPQPPELSGFSETFAGAPDAVSVRSAYGEGKRAAELLCALHAAQYHLEPTIARCFTFIGPYLPLDGHLAIGNFIRDALRGGPIVVRGDGTPYRSYLYAADLAIWLWTILFRGAVAVPYNVGSEEALPISGLARLAAEVIGGPVKVQIAQAAVPGKPAERYIPSTARAQAELRLSCHVDLRSAIRKTAAWAARASANPDETQLSRKAAKPQR